MLGGTILLEPAAEDAAVSDVFDADTLPLPLPGLLIRAPAKPV